LRSSVSATEARISRAGESAEPEIGYASSTLEFGGDFSWLVDPLWSLTLTATEQLGLGISANTTLGTTLAFQVQRRWFR
jgi:hypothetical protein